MPPEETTSSSDHRPHLQPQYSCKAWLTFFGEDNQGKLVLDIIVRISKATLVSYPGEKDLQVFDIHFILVSCMGFFFFICDIESSAPCECFEFYICACLSIILYFHATCKIIRI